ncbi:MAG TPA: flagellar biosynthesis anti-sigma factor FlgM [Ghiorsea sp.]|nr:flagellar biosynthesis anti-sigma factor FlgM [Ghiorsea sp.]HIP06586.1 flagellar biosynthesis anti-sigma factor FlgM [Mariprofundaceae bacterium]
MVRISGSSQPAGIHKSAGKPKGAAVKSGKSDSVKVSDAAGLRERAKVMLADMPDVRLDEIESIRNALEQGTYQMNNKNIATHIVRNALSEHAWG